MVYSAFSRVAFMCPPPCGLRTPTHLLPYPREMTRLTWPEESTCGLKDRAGTIGDPSAPSSLYRADAAVPMASPWRAWQHSHQHLLVPLRKGRQHIRSSMLQEDSHACGTPQAWSVDEPDASQ